MCIRSHVAVFTSRLYTMRLRMIELPLAPFVTDGTRKGISSSAGVFQTLCS